ncbi:MAG: UDP-N-acetylglucosamine 2-epimerase (non-hydrolyzing) [Actinomycetia bacterium]|nr:UDP-N-acetylglucosamine 2-epimerase (non-hydrolyzing) [Actinomycetes bacterium]MCP4958083.1 UDP-N-acetylglucosamine 2-epimerase (non-hydrolyzing) [Actinomycetes bacterium]
MRILVIVGTRPEAIKMAPVVHELRRRAIDHLVCLTGQHRELVQQVLDSYDMSADIDLDLMTPGQTVVEVAQRVLTAVEPVLTRTRPDWMLVQGDTTTVAAAALCAAWSGVKVGHVEAGLRSGDKTQPFPEEINRIVAGHVADRHFAPTTAAHNALLAEGVPARDIVTTGNTVIDALHFQRAVAPSPRSLVHRLDPHTKLMVLTAHRRENFGQPLRDALGAVAHLARQRSDLAVVYPVHPNPNVGAVARELLGNLDNVFLIEPVDHPEMVSLLTRAHLALTDSGGIQEEAPALDTPVLVLRDVTERPEAVSSGAARLVGTNSDHIISEVSRLLDDPVAHRSMCVGTSPYGDGLASRRIVSSLLGEAIREFSPPIARLGRAS